MKTKNVVRGGILLGALLLIFFTFYQVLSLQAGRPYPAPAPTSIEDPVEPNPGTGTPSTDPAAPDFLAMDRVLERLASASIVFNAPSHLNAEDTTEIQLVMSLAETAEMLESIVSAPGEKEHATVKVSKLMEAKLIGENYSIKSITPEQQIVANQGITEWKWSVHPTSEGRQTLYLTLTAILSVDGSTLQKSIRTFEKEIVVEVTATQRIKYFVENNWQWLWAAILIPLIGWLIKAMKTKISRRTQGE
ncbi:hypothetical protein [Pseudomonas sp. NPDC096950]|uniref:hypothetical protein n=1 Tax=Pseudomonas sp. NPDC096950 TaxID=3364485 RepID=UPI00383B200B